MSPRTGRRAGESGTREAILRAARARFADHGYDGATIRAIAADAGVDPALVHHFYGTKEDLFAAVMRLPISPGAIVAEAIDADPDRLGEALARAAFRAWEVPEARAAAVGLLRSAVANERAAQMLRQFVRSTIIGRIGGVLTAPDAELRASLVASQMVGLAFARYVVGIEPLASAGIDELVEAVGPTLQRYLTGELRPAAARPAR